MRRSSRTRLLGVPNNHLTMPSQLQVMKMRLVTLTVMPRQLLSPLCRTFSILSLAILLGVQLMTLSMMHLERSIISHHTNGSEMLDSEERQQKDKDKDNPIGPPMGESARKHQGCGIHTSHSHSHKACCHSHSHKACLSSILAVSQAIVRCK